MKEPTLYIVATPIGNTEDMTDRARRVLSEVDLIAAEDTRKTGVLLGLLELPKKPFVSYYDAVEGARSVQIVERIKKEGISVALVSDAGTPCISDPGYRIVALCRKEGIKVQAIPGPSALTTLVSGAGLPSSRLFFVGFLPTKEKALVEEMQSWQGLGASVVFYESPRRLQKTLALLEKMAPSVQVAIGRELTKMHEEVVLLPVEEAFLWASQHKTLKGEVSVMVDLTAADEEKIEVSAADLKQQLFEELQNGASFKDLLKKYRNRGLARGELYAQLVLAKKEMEKDG